MCGANTYNARQGAAESRPQTSSNAQVGVHFAQSIAHGGEVPAEVLDHVLNAPGVFEQVDALGVRVVVHRERPFNSLGKFPVENEKI